MCAAWALTFAAPDDPRHRVQDDEAQSAEEASPQDSSAQDFFARHQRLSGELASADSARAAAAEYAAWLVELEPSVRTDGVTEIGKIPGYYYLRSVIDLASAPRAALPAGFELHAHLEHAHSVAALWNRRDAECAAVALLFAASLRERAQPTDLERACGVLESAIRDYPDPARLPALHAELVECALLTDRKSAVETLGLDALGVIDGAPLDARGKLELRCRVYGALCLAAKDLGNIDQALTYSRAETGCAEELEDRLRIGAALVRTSAILVGNLRNGGLARLEELARPLIEDPLEWRDHPFVRGAVLTNYAIALGSKLRSDREVAAELFHVTKLVLDLPDSANAPVRTCRIWRARAALMIDDLASAAEEFELLGGARPDDESLTLEQRAILQLIESRILRERGETDAVRRSLERGFELQLRDWERSPLRDGGVGFQRFATRRELLGDLIWSTCGADGSEAAVARALRFLVQAHSMSTLVRREVGRRAPHDPLARLLSPAASPEEILARLRADLLSGDGALLVYLSAPVRSHAFVIDAERITHHELAGSPRLSAVARDYARALRTEPADGATDAERDAWRAHARAAADALLPADVRARLSAGAHLTVVGGAYFYDAPFDFLVLDDGKTLGETHPISTLPGLSLGLLIAERPDPRAREWAHDQVLLVGDDPGPGPPGQREPPAAFEFPATLRAHMAESIERTRTFAGEDATYENLARTLDEGARVEVVVAHGVRDRSRGDRAAGFVLHRSDARADGALYADDLEALPSAALVFLAVCRAGAGPVRLGDDGATHLGGATLAAGARVVVHSAVPVEYVAALRLVRSFQDSLRAGETPARAMQIARAALTQDDPDRAHPSYSLMRVEGLGHLPIF